MNLINTILVRILAGTWHQLLFYREFLSNRHKDSAKQDVFVLEDLESFWGRLDRYFSDAPLVQFVESFFFLNNGLTVVVGFLGEDHRGKVPFLLYGPQDLFCSRWPWPPGYSRVCQFPPLWSFSPRSAFQTVFSGRMSQVIRSGELGSLFLEWRISVIYLEFFCAWDLPLSMEKF